MKIQKIISICKSNKVAILYDAPEGQWLGNGSAMYRLQGFPEMSENNLAALIGIEEDKIPDWLLKEYELPEIMNVEAFTDDELVLMPLSPTLFYKGNCMVAFTADGEDLIIVNEKYLAPVDKTAEINFYLRKSGNMKYMIAKYGMLTQALIMPLRIDKDVFLDDIKTLYTLSQRFLPEVPRDNSVQMEL